MRQFMNNPALDEVLKWQLKETWEELKGVICGFLCNKIDYNYIQLLTVQLQKYHQLGVDEHEESFHQDNSVME